MKAFLQRVQFSIRHQAFHGPDLMTVRLHCKKRAGFDWLAIQQHRAGAATGGVAAYVGSGEFQTLANEVDQQSSGLYVALAVHAVHLYLYVVSIRHRFLLNQPAPPRASTLSWSVPEPCRACSPPERADPKSAAMLPR